MRFPVDPEHLLLSGVTDYAIYMLDPSGVILSWNTGGERIKGYSDAEVLGEHFSKFYTAEDRAVARRQFSVSLIAGLGLIFAGIGCLLMLEKSAENWGMR